MVTSTYSKPGLMNISVTVQNANLPFQPSRIFMLSSIVIIPRVTQSTWKVQRPVDPTFGWVGELAKEGDRKVVHRETKKTLTHMATTHRFVPTQVYRCEICDVLIKGWDFTMGDHLHKMHFNGCDISAEDQDYFYSNIQGMIVRKSKFKS